MIVQCEHCQTRFQLDESRIPARGIRVRCSRCKHAFFLAHPDASAAEAVEDVVEQAVVGDRTSPPDATEDLSAQSPGGDGSLDALARSGPLAEEGEESDWEFNTELPEPEAKASAATPAADSGDDAEGPFGFDDGSSGLLGADEPEPSPSPDEDSPLAAPADGAPDLAGVASVGAPIEPAPTVAGTDDAEPEKWDFFGDDALETPAAPPPSAPALPAVPAAPEQEVAEPSVRPEPAPSAWTGDAAADTAPARWRGAALGAAGWAAVLALFLAGAVPGVVRPLRGHGVSPDAGYEQDLGPLRARNVRATRLENARGDELVVVRGELRAPGSGAVRAGRVDVVLLDGRGRPLDVPAARVPAGVAVEASTLRTLSPDALAVIQRNAAATLETVRVSPGGALAFTAWFAELPEGAARFELERSEGARSEVGGAERSAAGPVGEEAAADPSP